MSSIVAQPCNGNRHFNSKLYAGCFTSRSGSAVNLDTTLAGMRRSPVIMTEVQLLSGFAHAVCCDRNTAAPTHPSAPMTFNDAFVLVTIPLSADTSTTKMRDFREMKLSNHMLLNDFVKVQVPPGQFPFPEESFPRNSFSSSI